MSAHHDQRSLQQGPLPEHGDLQMQYVYESSIHAKNLLDSLNDQRKNGLLCDITVIVEGVELRAHKAVLASFSAYFNTIITDPANVSHNIVLELSTISRLGMENLLEFAYTSKLTLSKKNICDVLNAAHELDIRNLEYSCLNLLKEKLIPPTTATSNPQTTNCITTTPATVTIPSLPSTSSSILVGSNKVYKDEEIMDYKPSAASTQPKTVVQVTTGDRCLTDFAKNGDCPMLAQLNISKSVVKTSAPQDSSKGTFIIQVHVSLYVKNLLQMHGIGRYFYCLAGLVSRPNCGVSTQ